MKKNNNSIFLIILTVLIGALLYLVLNYKPSYKNELNYRYAIPGVSYSEYNNLSNEINSITGINDAYIEKTIGNLEEQFTIEISSLEDFNALTEIENNLVSGRLPINENEIIIASINILFFLIISLYFWNPLYDINSTS